MNKDLKFICQLDGYNYYLGDVIAKDVNWDDAKNLVEKLGDGWELPSRSVAILAHNKFNEDMNSIDGWYWLGDEGSTEYAWGHFSYHVTQYKYDKTYTRSSYVRPVLKVNTLD